MSSSTVLQALGKFLPVIYQQGTTTNQRGICPPYPQAKYHIGDFAEGGVIIWLTQDGNHGLVAAIEDVQLGSMGYQINYTWGPYPSSPAGVTIMTPFLFLHPLLLMGSIMEVIKTKQLLIL